MTTKPFGFISSFKWLKTSSVDFSGKKSTFPEFVKRFPELPGLTLVVIRSQLGSELTLGSGFDSIRSTLENFKFSLFST